MNRYTPSSAVEKVPNHNVFFGLSVFSSQFDLGFLSLSGLFFWRGGGGGGELSRRSRIIRYSNLVDPGGGDILIV